MGRLTQEMPQGPPRRAPVWLVGRGVLGRERLVPSRTWRWRSRRRDRTARIRQAQHGREATRAPLVRRRCRATGSDVHPPDSTLPPIHTALDRRPPAGPRPHSPRTHGCRGEGASTCDDLSFFGEAFGRGPGASDRSRVDAVQPGGSREVRRKAARLVDQRPQHVEHEHRTF